MRVNHRPRTFDGERGAVAIVVALSAVALLGFAAFAIDAGDLWQTRRHLVTAVDAAALAAAQEYALGGDGCGAVDDDYIARNFPSATVVSCHPGAGAGVPGNSSGWVTVTAAVDVDLTFGGIIGIGHHTVTASTTANYGLPKGVRGLRPFALCAQSTGFAQWLAAGKPSPSPTYRVLYAKTNPADCGSSAPGNWGLVDFDGGANSSQDTKTWTQYGYDELVYIGTTNPCPAKPAPLPVGCYQGDTGAFSGSLPLDTLVGKMFAIPMFDSVIGTGSNARFHLSGFATVKLIGFKATGAESSRYLDLQFVRLDVEGSCCRTGIDTGVRVVQICGVEAKNSCPN